ncbi:uncharacterized protein C20orf173 homolog [Tupaia chinensis]|uniref:uncharacterized protein C20orf173 homolog n=1 Tax=Tupaia chinensis TaxID=246437 RepID=UPI000703C91C|nr:uncharacterized protein C20orf173 homolog [Tupaia chinensis]XP_014441625.1 uncharacterized protein C20orf173 homolog [Tupaia chinensis]
MKCWWQIFVLWVFWVLILWWMAPYLDLTPELALREKQVYLVSQPCNCPWFKLGTCGCPSGTLNCSFCLHKERKWDWFHTCYEKTMRYLMRTGESVTSDTVLWWLGEVWKKLSKMIPRSLVSHFEFYCGTCALLGNSHIVQDSSLSNSIDQHPVVFRMNQAPAQGFEMNMGNRISGHFICPSNSSNQRYWRQLVRLLLRLSDLAWTSDTLNDEIWEDGLVPWWSGK